MNGIKQGRVAGSAAIFKENKILLLKRSSNKSTYPDHWTFPSGGIEEGDENIAETVQREVKEETGLEFTPTEKFNFYDGSVNGTRYFALVHLGTWKGDIDIDKSEASDYDFFTYEEAIKLPLAFSYKQVLEDLYEKKLLY